jgi:hypothetical protein
MSNFKYIGVLVLSFIVMLEMLWMYSPKNKKGIGRFVKLPSASSIATLTVGMFAMFMIMFGAIFVIDLVNDGPYVFKDEKADLNSEMQRGNIPEMGDFVSVKFDEVGEPFLPEGREGMYYPIVIYDGSDDSAKSVCAIHVKDSEKSTVEKFKENPEGVLEYTGRILEINNYYDLYTQTVKESEMLGNGYFENRFVIDATADKETVKERLAFFGLWALGSMLCIVATLVTYFCYKNRKLKQNN